MIGGRVAGALVLFAAVVTRSCGVPPPPPPPQYGNPVPVTITGYTGDAMEPFVSPDGNYLFFNNSNDPSVNTDLFYARRVDDTTFTYAGPVAGANSAALDAVASMDSHNTFFFVSTRSYAQSLSTIYQATFENGTVTAPAIVPGISKLSPGWVNFDAGISPDGNTLYVVDGQFGTSGQPTTADIVMAPITANGFTRAANSAALLANVNTSALEYAPAISSDGLTLFFTRAPAPLGSGNPAIYIATRTTTSNAFGTPAKLSALTGFVEAPALSPDGSALYYHVLVNNRYVIYRASKL